MPLLADLKEKQVLIVGAGTTGKSIANLLVKEKISFTIFDEKAQELNGLPVVSELPAGIHVALVSPGWRKDHEIFTKLKAAGAQIISEIDFAWQDRKSHV